MYRLFKQHCSRQQRSLNKRSNKTKYLSHVLCCNEDDGCQFVEEAVRGRVLSTRSYTRQPTSARRLRESRSATQRGDKSKLLFSKIKKNNVTTLIDQYEKPGIIPGSPEE